jgi:hypothetical protein
MLQLVLQIRRILLQLGFYFTDCGIWAKFLAYRTVMADGQWSIARTANTRHLVFCMNCQKYVAHFSLLWQFAQWLCYHWHIAAVTERYANGLDAES